MLFQNEGLSVRELTWEDSELMARWLSDPAVLKYYEGRDNPFDIEKVRQKFFARNDGELRCIVEYEKVAIGYIQYYELDDDTKKGYGYANRQEIIYGMDQFIGNTSFWNKGIGTQLVTSMVKFLIEQKQADRVVMDPQTQNERALRCYEKCGFNKVKLLPKNELHEGEYRNCWLIEYKT